MTYDKDQISSESLRLLTAAHVGTGPTFFLVFIFTANHLKFSKLHYVM